MSMPEDLEAPPPKRPRASDATKKITHGPLSPDAAKTYGSKTGTSLSLTATLHFVSIVDN